MKTRITLENQTACYHCMSRTVHGERWLDEHERAVLGGIFRRVAEFSGVRLLTFCIMSNHFHLLVEVPRKADREALDNAELERRYRVLYGEKPPRGPGQLSADEVAAVFAAGGAAAETLRERLLERMHDLSAFMECVKVRFTRWYNHKHETFGTVWAGRFKSVIIEGEAEVLKDVAAYIDLNPVRAGMVEDPARYPFSGFGAASLGDEAAKESLEYLSCYGFENKRRAMESYKALLYTRGSVGGGSGKGGKIPPEICKAVFAEIAATPVEKPWVSHWGKILRNAFILGSPAFLEKHSPILGALMGRKKPIVIQRLGKTGNETPSYAFANRRAKA